MNTRATGNVGEALAVNFLGLNGFDVIKQNYRNKLGEIDIIAERAGKLHFIEVKFRRTNTYGSGREAVTWSKQRRIRDIATAYLKYHQLYNKVFVSFDVIEISGNDHNATIDHIIGCF